MDPRITDLKSTTFSGRRLTRRQIADIQKTVALYRSPSPQDQRPIAPCGAGQQHSSPTRAQALP